MRRRGNTVVRLTPGIPAGTRTRLVEHYGPTVRTWLHGAGNKIAATAAQSEITVDGFHDAGWTSVVAVGRDAAGQLVILKAFPDPDRYHHEQAALTHWAGHSSCCLLGSDDTARVLIIELVGRAAGGASAPNDAAERVADVLPQLHRIEVEPDSSVPTLRDYYRQTVLPRIQHRASRHGTAVGEETVCGALDLGAKLCTERHRRAMLHSDLYAENVVFDAEQVPVFIDPHPKIGSPAFDWAFWCVYYRQDGGFATRVALCRSHVPDLANEVLAWSLTLAVDGALYYTENNDPDAAMMLQVLASPELAHVRW
ncbi:MAG: phosphotransferase [Pseudonocardiaceae bacterium]|nr:phosphotransferase [Pseudonocardiaceae bacterium]